MTRLNINTCALFGPTSKGSTQYDYWIFGECDIQCVFLHTNVYDTSILINFASYAILYAHYNVYAKVSII